MNLIIFMLLSITGLASFGILNVNAPNYGGPTAGVQQENPDEPKLTLSVLISKKGPSSTARTRSSAQGGDAPTIPAARRTARYDYAALNAKMVEIKQAFPARRRSSSARTRTCSTRR